MSGERSPAPKTDGSSSTGGEPLKVCIVAPSLDISGGQAVQASLLLKRLNQLPELEVSFLPINPRLPGPLHHLQRIKYLRTLLTSVVYIASLLLRVPKYDVLHIFSASYLSFVLAPTPALLTARLYGKPTILNYRSGEADDHLARWRRTAIPTLKSATEIVVPSGYLVDVFADHGLSASAIPNFVELDQFRFREREPLRPVFLSNRNFEPHYNVAAVLRAFGRIQERYPDARLLVAGDGPGRPALEALAADLELRNVEFLGSVDHAEMGGLYDRADIYLNAPNIDNMPVSILEAFAAGTPVVSTDAGGIPYIVRHGDNGVLVERNDDAAMAEAAIRLLENPAEAAAMARRALEGCRSNYRWPTVSDQWLDMYRSVASRDAA